jgi:hypothetical protein
LASLQSREIHAAEFDEPLPRLRGRADNDEQFADALIVHVIKRCVLHPRGKGYRRRCSGIDISFAEPYQLPPKSVDAIRDSFADARSRELRRAQPWPRRSTHADGELAYELYRQGQPPADIARAFNALGRPTQQGSGRWLPGDIAVIVRRICDERDVPYEARRSTGSRWSYEARTLVYELALDPAQLFPDIAATLNEMGVEPPPGTLWNGLSVRQCYVSECRRRQEPFVPRAWPRRGKGTRRTSPASEHAV